MGGNAVRVMRKLPGMFACLEAVERGLVGFADTILKVDSMSVLDVERLCGMGGWKSGNAVKERK